MYIKRLTYLTIFGSDFDSVWVVPETGSTKLLSSVRIFLYNSSDGVSVRVVRVKFEVLVWVKTPRPNCDYELFRC